MPNINVYYDHLKPGEYRPASMGPWCYTISKDGHIIKTECGFHSEEAAHNEARKHA